MKRTTTTDFDGFTDFITETIEKKNIKQQEDQVILCCGYEGSGKSTFTIATYCDVCRKRDLTPRPQNIFYEWREYLNFNLHAMLDRINNYPENLIKQLIEYYSIGAEDLDAPKDTVLPEIGDILCYDEAGTQAFNRQAMKGQNINQAKLLIANRFLNLCHIWNVPKPGSVDKYIREERAKIMIYVDAYYSRDWEQKIRRVYVWGKESYNKIIYMDKWWTLFGNIPLLLRKRPPDIAVRIPDNLPKMIPPEIWEHYNAKKTVFNIHQTLEMIRELGEEEAETKKPINYRDRLVKDGESLKEWVDRTNCNPTDFSRCGGKRKKVKAK